jgi:hypothetical protein
MTVLGIGTKVNIENLNIEGLIDVINIENVPPAVTYVVRYFVNGEERRATCGEYELSFDHSEKLEIGFK